MQKKKSPPPHYHESIMVEEVLNYFAESHLKIFCDGTLGAGGHAKALLNAHPEIELYVGLDQDQSALEIAKESLKEFGERVLFVNANFRDLDQVLKGQKIEKVDGFFLT